jgi:hypothetical protein
MNSQVMLIAIAITAWATLVFGALYLDAKLGGWWSLADKYPCPAKQSVGGRTWWVETVILENGGSAYSGLLTITANSIGMRIRAPIMLRLLYPDLFLPWKDVTAVRERGWLWDKVHLTFSAVPDVPVTIWATLADKILAYVGPVWIDHLPEKPVLKSLPNP